MLDTHIRLRAVRGDELRVGAEDGRSDSDDRCESVTAAGRCKDAGRVCIVSNLLEGLYSVFLNRAVEKRQRQPVIEKPKAGTHDPFLRGTPSQAQPWIDVVFVGTKRRRQMLRIVSPTDVQS